MTAAMDDAVDVAGSFEPEGVIDLNMAKTEFTHWGMAANSRDLELWIQHDGRVTESLTLDICTLPQRPDVLTRMPGRFRDRFLREAAAEASA